MLTPARASTAMAMRSCSRRTAQTNLLARMRSSLPCAIATETVGLENARLQRSVGGAQMRTGEQRGDSAPWARPSL